MSNPVVPFKTPVDYFTDLLGGESANLNHFARIWRQRTDWRGFDEDLHVYPYTHAFPCALSLGCPNKCPFCPTARVHRGLIHRGAPELILPPYEGLRVHFMDENFFRAHEGVELRDVLRLLKTLGITWLCMSDAQSVLHALDDVGEQALWEAGLRVIEVGLENVALYNKVPPSGIPTTGVVVYYLNMTFFPGETKETIIANAEWMKGHSLRHPIHHNNGLYYAPGQFLFDEEGRYKNSGLYILDFQPFARTRPTFIPTSFLEEKFEILNLERVNFFAQLVYGIKLYPKARAYGVGEFCGKDWRRYAWVVVGLRCGGLK